MFVQYIQAAQRSTLFSESTSQFFYLNLRRRKLILPRFAKLNMFVLQESITDTFLLSIDNKGVIMKSITTETLMRLEGLLKTLGEVRCRSLFGGYSLTIDKAAFGMLVEGELFLRANEQSAGYSPHGIF